MNTGEALYALMAGRFYVMSQEKHKSSN